MSARSRSRGARVVRVALYGLAAVHVLEALALRRRRDRLVALPEATQPESAPEPEVDVVVAAGVEVDPVTVAAAARELAATGADVVDLVPADLPPAEALQLLRRVDPEQLGQDILYAPGGAHQAVVRRGAVAQRMAERPDGAGQLAGQPSPADLVRFTRLAQRYAPGKSLMRVAPRLRAAPRGPEGRWQEREELAASARLQFHVPTVLHGLETGHLLLMTAGLVVAPAAATAALVTWSLQPALVLGGRPATDGADAPGRLRPPGLGRACVTRLASAWRDNLRTAVVAFRDRRRTAAQRLSAPIHRTPPARELFEDRRSTCPWCSSPDLVAVLDVPDITWRKPGWFHLDECGRCRHIFQNPMLSPRGLDYYYDQIYDGPNEELAELAFVAQRRAYDQRVHAVARVTEPHAWLDVGTGRGHFCMVARQEWPDAVFDGLDMSASVEEAARRGWLDVGHRGMFPELAGGLPRSYDVVSMHHYLEHTPDPRREIDAAAKMLEPGGHLMIEVPDPECLWARRLGAYWFSWVQPQHLHFITSDNLISALDDSGFEVLSLEKGAANMGGDASWAVLLAAMRLAPNPHLPWSPPGSPFDPVKRAAVFAAAMPLLVVAQVVDRLEELWLSRPGTTRPSNTYRVVARRL